MTVSTASSSWRRTEWFTWSNKASVAASQQQPSPSRDDEPSSLPKPTDALFQLVQERNWHRAIRHCQANPWDAQYVSQQGETPLYVACQNRPNIQVIRALLQAHPQATTTTATMANSCDGGGVASLPIHMACQHNASLDVVRELLKQAPETALQLDADRKSLLQLLVDSRIWTESERIDPQYGSVFWKKVHVVLAAIQTPVLHAALSLGPSCPTMVVDYVVATQQHDVNTRDAKGRLPLHVAVQVPAPSHPKFRPHATPRGALDKIVAMDPSAAAMTVVGVGGGGGIGGQYPLHIALSQGHSWHRGIKDLMEAAPNVLIVRDAVTGLYPFQMATDVDTIYSLLRTQPHALSTMTSSQTTGSEQRHHWPEELTKEDCSSDTTDRRVSTGNRDTARTNHVSLDDTALGMMPPVRPLDDSQQRRCLCAGILFALGSAVAIVAGHHHHKDCLIL